MICEPELGQIFPAGGAPEVIRVSLDGVKRIDVSFASEAIIKPAARHLGTKAFCLDQASDDDVVDNISAAALSVGLPLTIWDQDKARVVGLAPREGLQSTLDLALERNALRAGDLVRIFAISSTNASNKLKQLWLAGFLLRDEVIAQSGGLEFVYRRIG